MQRAFKKIIEKLMDKSFEYDNKVNDEMIENGHTLDFEHYFGRKAAYEDAIEIVNQVASEYNSKVPATYNDALTTIEKIKDIIREEEHYEVSDSIENPRPNKADYDAVHAEKFNRIWKIISEAEEKTQLRYRDMNNSEIRKISYENCPLKCTGCESKCDEMSVGQCRESLSLAYDDKESGR